MSKTKVLVLGAGKVGKSVAELLLACGRGAYHVTLADANQANLDEARANLDRLKGLVPFDVTFDTRRVDASKPDQVAKALKGQYAVVCMLPFNFVKGVAQQANDLGVHYFDVTEDVETTDAVIAIDDPKGTGKGGKASVALVPQCGLAPGYIAIAAFELAKRFSRVHDLTLRVGALPQYPTNQLKYNVTWSTAGVINEYCEPCNVLLHGKTAKVPALEGLEGFSLAGVDYEAFYTSGGVGTLIDTLTRKGLVNLAPDHGETPAGPLSTVAYKTIRYPGHRNLMKFLLQDLKLGEEHSTKTTRGNTFDRALLVDLFDHALPRTLQDRVVIFIHCAGIQDGRLVQTNFERVVPAIELFGRIWPAIELTTAAGVCAMVDLHRQGQLPRQKGFIRQEEVSLEAFNQTLFGLCYENPMALESAILKS